MNFQTTLPYAADSGLHVIEGLDVTGTPIYQRSGDWRFKPVDMYTLLQGIIERCLATQTPDGGFLVSPTIFNNGMFSTDAHIPYAPLSKWTERTYPAGVLNEVSGYVANLMDWYPQHLLLLAIDDKIWQLGSCVQGSMHLVSCYLKAGDNGKPEIPFEDATDFMNAAGVGYDPITYEMQLIPARITGGAPIYGAPGQGGRIYPELLIDRYKVIQQMRYLIPPTYELKEMRTKKSAAADDWGSIAYAYGEDGWSYYPDMPAQFYQDYYGWAWYDWYKETAVGLTLPTFKANFLNPAYWQENGTADMYLRRHSECFYNRYGSINMWQIYVSQTSPDFKIWAYKDIQRDLEIWGVYPGGETCGLKNAEGGELVVGNNKLKKWDNSISQYEEFKSSDGLGRDFEYVWNAASPNGYYGSDVNIQLSAVADYHFNFCKHHDFGGDVTWTA